MEECADQDSRLSFVSVNTNNDSFSGYNNSQDAEMSNQSEGQGMTDFAAGDSLSSSIGKGVSRRGTRGKRRNADQEKNSTASKRGKRFVLVTFSEATFLSKLQLLIL